MEPVDHLEAVVTSLRERGTPFRNEIISGPGGRQILCEDPSGNPIELFEAA
jgi:predicted enzyme related to lactoylglutathione lyase